MLYMRFTSVALNQWDVYEPAKSTKPIARIAGRKVTPLGTVSRDEVDGIAVFIRGRRLPIPGVPRPLGAHVGSRVADTMPPFQDLC